MQLGITRLVRFVSLHVETLGIVHWEMFATVAFEWVIDIEFTLKSLVQPCQLH